MRVFTGFATLLTVGIISAAPIAARQGQETEPLVIARILAAKYPAQPIMSYIPALSWSGGMR